MRRFLLPALSTLMLLSTSRAQPQTAPALSVDATWQPETASVATAFTIHSPILGETRRVFIALPASHPRTKRPYPVTLVFDGESIFTTILQNALALVSAGHIPESILVGVENTDRLRDLSPPGLAVSGNDGEGRADRFMQFLEYELLPSLQTGFRASGPVALVGHSSGGLFVHYAMLQNAERFPYILALDTPMHLGDRRLAYEFAAFAQKGGRAAVLVSMEAKYGWPSDVWDEIQSRSSASVQVSREKLSSESHASMVWPGSYRGLKALFRAYGGSDEASTRPVARLAAFDTRLPDRRSMPPPRNLLQSALQDQIEARDLEAAAITLRRLAAAYGEDDVTAALQKDLASARTEDVVGPTLEAMIAAPRPPAAAMEPLVGSWQGHTEHEGGRNRTPLGLEVWLENGLPTGRFTFAQGPGHEIEYMSVSEAVFKIGYLNRMRPRGMLVYEGRITAGIFSGEFAVRGVSFRLPRGREIPKIYFKLSRVED